MKKYKVGIIGCGVIFDRHLEAIQQNSDNYELVAICDIDEKKLNIRAKEYSVPGFTDYKEMLKKMKGKIDFVSIITPNSLHFQQTIDALNAGCDTLTEKPVVFSHKKVSEIDNHAKKLGRKAFAVLQVRYNPTIGMVKEALENNYVGEIRSVSLVQRWQRPSSYFDSWRADINIGGRILYEVGIHYLDIFQLLFGQPKVIASATYNNKHKHVEFEDTVFSIMKMQNGGSASIEVTIASEPSNLECSISIMGSEGYIKIGGRALDKVEIAAFSNIKHKQNWDELVSRYGKSIEPNSYGTHAGSCPNHPTLYTEIANGRGFQLLETVNCIKLIEDIYNKEINYK